MRYNLLIARLLCVLHIIVFLNVLAEQNTYVFKHEYAEISEYNASLISITAVANKLNRTTMGVNITFALKVDILSDADVMVTVIGYQFRSNQYRYGPIDFNVGICSLFRFVRINMVDILSKSNVTGCPLIGSYYIHNMTPNATHFPPNIPEGKWMLELKFMYKEIYMLTTLKWFAKVENIFKFHK